MPVRIYLIFLVSKLLTYFHFENENPSQLFVYEVKYWKVTQVTQYGYLWTSSLENSRGTYFWRRAARAGAGPTPAGSWCPPPLLPASHPAFHPARSPPYKRMSLRLLYLRFAAASLCPTLQGFSTLPLHSGLSLATALYCDADTQGLERARRGETKLWFLQPPITVCSYLADTAPFLCRSLYAVALLGQLFSSAGTPHLAEYDSLLGRTDNILPSFDAFVHALQGGHREAWTIVVFQTS